MNNSSSFITLIVLSSLALACDPSPRSPEEDRIVAAVSTETLPSASKAILVSAPPPPAKAIQVSRAAGGEPNADAATQRATEIARGGHIVLTSGCNDCHTPWKMGDAGPEPDMTRMLSGHPQGMQLPPPPAPQGPWIVSTAATNTAFAGPWGVSFTANLTPDETGLGTWTFENFKQTIRTGRHLGRGRPVLPPMPIPMYKNFTDDELHAIYTYLRSIPSVKNRVPDPLPPAGAG